MNDATIIEFAGRDTVSDPLTDLLRKGARELLQTAVEAELDAFPGRICETPHPGGPGRGCSERTPPRTRRADRDRPGHGADPEGALEDGRACGVPLGAGPAYVRKAKSIEAALPWLYLKGISTGEMGAALKALLGPDATGFSAKTVARLKAQWAEEYDAWRKADLGRDEWVYVWADGIYSGLRGTDDRLCALVVIGVNARGEKHFLAIEDGVRESTQSWREVLLGLKKPRPQRSETGGRRRGHGILGGS